jgi:EAL domain-containing protein (putative c-di-GMP-specific phosphodiesterase class I)
MPFRIDDNEYHVKAKCGAVLFQPGAKNIEVLLRHAEVALLHSKRSVENIVFYRSDMDQRAVEALNLENKLRRALEHNEFVLHYQPKLCVADQTVTSVEALIRWNDHESLVPPGLFIPILEKTGMILDVGRWVLRQAATDYRNWLEKGLLAPRVAVNVSAVQLGHHNFVPDLQRVTESGADASGLDLEITESVIMESMEDNIAKLRAARDLGMSIAIDDFGTGYSSLSYLAKLPVNTLKIDRSFVLEMTTGEQGKVLVASIITLAHSLKLKVVAEGVETQQQATLLTQLSCDEIQGYLISRPIPASTLEKMLKKRSVERIAG